MQASKDKKVVQIIKFIKSEKFTISTTMVNYYSAGTDFSRQNLMSADVRF